MSRVAFAGTPEVAISALAALVHAGHDVAWVLTRPDAPAGRGRVLTPSPVAQWADEHGLLVVKSSHPAEADLDFTDVDAVVVVAYGAMIPQSLLDAPRHGWLNIHFSLLPQLRGAAPVQRAIWNGQTETGVTIFRIDEGLDTGPILSQVSADIHDDETSGELLHRLVAAGSELLIETLSDLDNASEQAAIQTGEPTHAAKIYSADAQLNWSQSARELSQQFRACTPVPGAWTMTGELRVKILDLSLADSDHSLQPGHVVLVDQHVLVGTTTGPVVVELLQPAGKSVMAARDWVRGQRDEVTFA